MWSFGRGTVKKLNLVEKNANAVSLLCSLLFSVYLFYVVAMFAGAYDGFGLARQHAGQCKCCIVYYSCMYVAVRDLHLPPCFSCALLRNENESPTMDLNIVLYCIGWRKNLM